MCTVGDMVRVLQTINPNIPVDELFQNSTFTSQIRDVVNLWPEKSKKTARKILQQSGRLERRSLPSEEALRAIRRTKDIDLPATLTIIYEKWQRDPSTFWNSQGLEIGSRNIYQVYRGMKQLETQRHSGTIIWRYFTMFFYDLMGLLGDGRKYLVETLQDKLVNMIDVSGLVNASKITIQKDIKRWASAGSKYCNIARVLGNGALILLPHDVTDNIWENRLPMKGACFEEAMDHLTGLGIREVSKRIGADDLGRDIREVIIRPFREIVHDQLCLTDLSNSQLSSVRDLEREPVRNEGVRLTGEYEDDSLQCFTDGSRIGASIEQSEMKELLSTQARQVDMERNRLSLDRSVVDHPAEESGATRGGQAQETFTPSFDIANYLTFMPTPESSVSSQGFADEECATVGFSQFNAW
ncbi:hypothetical protein BP6252_06733 [Coleophoma cylindrospora]|uniref:Uncharacterized protein n=1 Tax=Coleophoma cylindrospora TaxID=1849047 RepID=A0A3D8RFT3_9HELO|nr:hypothetical protein BP6252_06733 [Coleophoma cylindrospora]